MTFTNWARNQSCEPTRMASPSSAQEVASLITRAAEQGERVKAVGTGHSFTATAMTDGVLLSLENLASIHKMDTASGLVTVGAGMRLDELNVRLDEAGLAMPNLGDIAVQTVAGATSTATHGTGTGLGNLATQIVGMEIVAGTGEVLRLDSQNRPDLLRMARVGLGALGVVTEVTLQTVPSFRLRAVEEIGEIDDVTARLEEFLTASDHAEFFWIPGTTACQTKSNNRTEEPLAPQSKVKYFIDKIVGENIAFDVLMRAARRFPSQTERIRSVVVNAGSNRELVDQSYKIFASPRHVRFVEMEYGIPREALGEVLERVRRGVDQMDRPPLFPVEVRASAADDIPLSTGYKRDSGWVAVHQYRGMEFEPYFRMVEAIMDDYDGRPHWGKMHFQSAATLASRYPEWEAFASARAELDPAGVFRNDYLDRVLGPIGGL